MEQQVVSYIKKHTFMMAVLVVSGFILLGMGQYYLYRQQMHINKMVAEGLMQIKEAQSLYGVDEDVTEGLPVVTETE